MKTKEYTLGASRLVENSYKNDRLELDFSTPKLGVGANYRNICKHHIIVAYSVYLN